MKSYELSTINAELKKLGISGDRGELTQAGRDLDIQEVRKRRVDGGKVQVCSRSRKYPSRAVSPSILE